MEAKEKAKDLVERFKTKIDEFAGNTERHAHSFAKQCALICVDEMIKQIEGASFLALERYYEQIKIEIKKL